MTLYVAACAATILQRSMTGILFIVLDNLGMTIKYVPAGQRGR